jgi:hypothetical protein
MSSEILEIVDAWFREKLQTPPISYHSECYDQVHSAWQDLRKRLGAQPESPPTPPGEDAGDQGSEAGGQPAGSSETQGKSSKAGK